MVNTPLLRPYFLGGVARIPTTLFYGVFFIVVPTRRMSEATVVLPGGPRIQELNEVITSIDGLIDA